MTTHKLSVRGSVTLESLLTFPVILLMGLGIVQLGLIYQARQALRYAVHEAVRQSSLDHAQPLALRRGLARGWAPWLYGASDWVAQQRNILRAQGYVAQGEVAGWLWIEQLSPHAASFHDWGQPALDERSQWIPDVVEIPHDQLDGRIRLMTPRSGVSAQRGGDPVGRVSGQTLREANLLQMRVHYGVPLMVPIVGRALIWTLRRWHGCPASSTVPGGLFSDGTAMTGTLPDRRRCLMYGQEGTATEPRLPLMIQASIVMHSAARQPR